MIGHEVGVSKKVIDLSILDKTGIFDKISFEIAKYLLQFIEEINPIYICCLDVTFLGFVLKRLHSRRHCYVFDSRYTWLLDFCEKHSACRFKIFQLEEFDNYKDMKFDLLILGNIKHLDFAIENSSYIFTYHPLKEEKLFSIHDFNMYKGRFKREK